MRNVYVSSTDMVNKRKIYSKITKQTSNAESQGKRGEIPKYDDSKIQEMIYDIERKFNRHFLNDDEVV